MWRRDHVDTPNKIGLPKFFPCSQYLGPTTGSALLPFLLVLFKWNLFLYGPTMIVVGPTSLPGTVPAANRYSSNHFRQKMCFPAVSIWFYLISNSVLCTGSTVQINGLRRIWELRMLFSMIVSNEKRGLYCTRFQWQEGALFYLVFMYYCTSISNLHTTVVSPQSPQYVSPQSPQY